MSNDYDAESKNDDSTINNVDPHDIKRLLQTWAEELGFDQLNVADVNLSRDEQRLSDWVAAGLHADMGYMSKHGTKRTRPEELVPGTVSVISVRINYLPEPNHRAIKALENKDIGYISRYALGRDYHKVIRKKLKKLADRLAERVGPFGHRVFTDSAPVLERALARKAGLGWVGKHTNLIERHNGSWFFIGEIYTDLALPFNTEESQNYCGSCTACLDICPTQAIVAPYVVDAYRCISYQTIENKGPIPVVLRADIGNRIFGCDDCQLVCPWNRYAKLATEASFEPREQLKDADLLTLFNWSEQEFLANTEGSAIRRINHEQWLRNVAVAIGNASKNSRYVAPLKQRLVSASAMLKEHLEWALNKQTGGL
ncbi:MAG: tRNA epoxyqueuosine(34) reductase QueG [Gammaproteobacteria bacterium]